MTAAENALGANSAPDAVSDKRPDATRRALVGRAMLGVPLTLAGAGWATRASADTTDAVEPAEAAAARPASQVSSPAMTGDVIEVPLWPEGQMPGVRNAARVAAIGAERVSASGAIRNVSQPRLRIYPANPARRTGMAMLVIAGGGYAHIECGHESTPASRWLQSIGITACELIYRLPREGWDRTVPLQDGQRAMRLIRAHAQTLHIEATRLGVMGFSAGGHLAGMTAVTPDIARYAPHDAMDTLPSGAAFAALLYPVLTLMPPFDKTHTRRSLLGRDDVADTADAASNRASVDAPGSPLPSATGPVTDAASLQVAIALSVERHVDAASPPVFLAQATDDPISPVDNSLLMYSAMRSAGRPVDLHLFQSGGHGWGMGRPGTEQTLWPALFEAWLKSNRLL
jgi:acetyl esterase/lipase